MLVHSAYRKVFELSAKAASVVRIIHLRLKYPSLQVNFGSYISRNCQITCANSGTLILHNAVVGQNVVLKADVDASLMITDAYVGYGSVIAAHKKIEINAYCEIAEMAVIRDQNHMFGGATLLRDSGLESAPIILGRNVWVGAKATILKGVTIGENSVVGANAVVTKDVPSDVVVTGIPAEIKFSARHIIS